MESLGETFENIGLAQEIQNGLVKSLQREPEWPDADTISAKYAELIRLGEGKVYEMRLGRFLMHEWSKSAGRKFAGVSASDHSEAWTAFTASKTFDLLAKYAALSDKVGRQVATHKQFVEARPLGRGAFGVVFLVFKRDTGAPLATKKIVKGLAKQNNMLESVCIEQTILSKVTSRFTVGLHYSYQDDVCVYLVMSLCPGGDLWFLIQQRCKDPKTGKECPYIKLPIDAIKFYTASMACGLQAIHDAGFVYRDLKPHNVLLDAEGQLRISDMGLCVDISTGPVSAETDPLGPSIKHGTCGYWPPEVIKEQPYKTEPDYWALGCTAFQLFCDRLPFFGQNDDEKNAMILQAEEKLPTRFTHGEPDDFQGFITDLLNVDTQKRLGCTRGLVELKEHAWFGGFDWDALEGGLMPAPIQPNVNDINAPSKSEIAPFVKPKGVTWEDKDQALFAKWEFVNPVLHGEEAIVRIKKRRELVDALAADGLKPVGDGAAVKASGGCCSLQ